MNYKSESKKTYCYTVLAMRFLEKILGAKITTDGLENIPSKPVLFVCNHFTRSETFVVPYIIYKKTKRQVRCLADSGLFHGVFGRFLKSVGAISTKDPNRDKIIISDMMDGKYDWMIYPEGVMIKSKEIHNKDALYLFRELDSDLKQGVHTGAATLALKAQIYRSELIDAKIKGRTKILEYYKDEFGIDYDCDFKNAHIHIIPVNITYYPIRPGKNIIQSFVKKIIKKIPKKIVEELEIEGNLLLSSNMNIHFGKEIGLQEYTKIIRGAIYKMPFMNRDAKINLAVTYFKNRLTNKFMQKIYTNTQINIDHVASAILFLYPKEKISIYHFKSLLYLSIAQIIIFNKYRIHPDIKEKNIFQILAGENFNEFDGVMDLAKMSGIVGENMDHDSYFINKSKIGQRFDFHQIRIENTLQVIMNEFLLLNSAVAIVKRNVLLGEAEVRKRNSKYIISKDLESFKNDYLQYYDSNLSKPESIGRPLFLDSKKDNSDGILLVHGYLSAPKEMEEMAQYFNKLGYKTYSVRLKGHGTAPINLQDVKWQDWYVSLNRGYVALKLICNKVFIVGFSTGGLLSIIAAFRKDNEIDGIVCINPALKLRDIRSKFASQIHMWNEFLEKLNISKGQLKYVENDSESPENNYSQNYVQGIKQLEILMDYCEVILSEITCPTLIIQSIDPVIDSQSSKSMLKRIGSKKLSFKEIDLEKHSIVKGVGSEEVFDLASKFIKSN
ncbi:MAG: esterase/lipase/1-acyl-sn-glycerol-3-phosphate acyltransferase [Rickettsiales bacterium]|jgi:esterase/lipase/1-acyl-sn-glycerol-3-phosphate acyltransferase